MTHREGADSSDEAQFEAWAAPRGINALTRSSPDLLLIDVWLAGRHSIASGEEPSGEVLERLARLADYMDELTGDPLPMRAWQDCAADLRAILASHQLGGDEG